LADGLKGRIFDFLPMRVWWQVFEDEGVD